MNVKEKYPLAYTQRFDVIDIKLEKLQAEIDALQIGARYIDIQQDPESGIITVMLLNDNQEIISSAQLRLNTASNDDILAMFN